jgi:hypothetical protein
MHSRSLPVTPLSSKRQHVPPLLIMPSIPVSPHPTLGALRHHLTLFRNAHDPLLVSGVSPPSLSPNYNSSVKIPPYPSLLPDVSPSAYELCTTCPPCRLRPGRRPNAELSICTLRAVRTSQEVAASSARNTSIRTSSRSYFAAGAGDGYTFDLPRAYSVLDMACSAPQFHAVTGNGKGQDLKLGLFFLIR